MSSQRFVSTLASMVLLVSATLSSAFAQFFQQGPKLVGAGAVGLGEQGNSVALSADGNTAVEGGPADNDGVGAVWVFTRTNGVWSQQGPKLLGSGAVGNARQGFSVALSADGNTLIEGGPSDGSIWVFTRSNGVWSQQGSKLAGTGAVGGGIGSAVAVSADGNTAIAGSYSDNNQAGAVWIFTRSNGVWSQQGGKLVGTGAVNGLNGALQGTSVGISGDGNTVVESGPWDNSYVGAVWIFTRTNGVWTQQGNKLVATLASFEGFGVALSGDGNTAIAGGFGGASIFTRSGGVWSHQASGLFGSDATNQAAAAVGLSADGNTAILGLSGDNDSVGAAWIFIRFGGVWSQLGKKMVGADSSILPEQGQSVALSADGNTAMVGGPYDNGCTLIPPCPSPGASWIYARLALPTPGIYILDSGNHVVRVYDTRGNPVTSLPIAIPQPSGITLDSSGYIWLTDASLNQVEKVDYNGYPLVRFGVTGRGAGQLYQPYGIAIDSLGNVWVADTGNSRIQKFDGYGNFLLQLGGLGGGNGQFNAPVGIAIDGSGNIWVADTGNDRIQKFDGNGNFLLKFGSFGNAGGLFEGPFSIAFDSSGNAWISDPFNQRIQQFSSAGVFLHAFSGGFSFPSPYGVAVDSLGDIWGVDYNLSQFTEFNSSGAESFQFGTIGPPAIGQFYHPTYIVAK